ncbi:uncharacterized protein N7483_000270 [Penicillium malachiteum]|uniref:uncharacterized protein n=1 Tax=Penicillium malachiteum TaxID=1324776 RepID=UPI002547F4C7|nr:uncharacterized protein N7483_000270 [Penicillium malachiteum]KAJ5735145.1 hypothetical protein N7483_000270 [Penicillium malachiteum]
MSLLGKKFPGALSKPMAPFFAAVSHPAQIRLDSILDIVVVMSWLQERHSRSPIPVQQSHSRNQQLTLDLLAAEFKNDPRNPNAGKPSH